MSPNTHYNPSRVLVDMAEAKLRHWCGDDATREQAQAALATAKFRTGLSDEIRDRVLERFEHDRDPIPGIEWLPTGDECPDCGPACICDLKKAMRS